LDVERFYRAEKIQCRLARKPQAATGTAVILLNAAGQNQIVIEPGANARLAARDVPAAWLAGAKVVMAQLESNLTATGQVLRRARRNGVTTVLNPAPMRGEFNPAWLREVDVLIPNESEFAALVRALPGMGRPHFREADLAAAEGETVHRLCRQMGVPTVIVTLGARGCLVSEGAGWNLVRAHRVARVVDTTGAGDAFCGGFAAGLVRTGRVVEAAKFGTAVAALSITKPGAAGAMPTRREIERFLRQAQ
jgi:ribokinase